MAVSEIRQRKNFAGTSVVIVLSISIGLLIGELGHLRTKDSSKPDGHARMKREAIEVPEERAIWNDNKREDAIDRAVAEVDPTRIRSFLQELSKEPHIADLRRDQELVKWIMEQWKSAGLDNVETAEYDAYLSWPNQTNPNKIRLLDKRGRVRFTSKHKEEEVRRGDDHPEFVHAFNGYAPAADIEVDLANVVFTHYGRVEDMRQVEDMGISIEGKVCIARYGKIYRGNKVQNCQERGGVAVILYSDPDDVATEGTHSDDVYPNTFFLPGSGMQRGTTFFGFGDPLSPLFPSVKNAYRLEPENVKHLPKIPAQPIGYDDAKSILETLGGQGPPEGWKGGIKDIDYSLGGEEHPKYKGWKLHFKTNNHFDTKKAVNVIGYLHGSVEPDRYVLMSNHRDAWGYGAADPSSGTASMMETVQILGNLVRQGWRPRRTIVFASWGSEEYGMLGSNEWVEDKKHKIMERMVGVLNVDTCVTGPISKSAAAPCLQDLLIESYKHAYDLESDSLNGRTYYDYWMDWHNSDKIPEIEPQAYGSDDGTFAFYAGVPGIDVQFKIDDKKHKGVHGYPLYHTGYETFYYVDKIVDPDFKIHRTCVQVSLFMLLQLADSTILPFNLNRISKAMKAGLVNLDENGILDLLDDNNIDIEPLREAIDEFEKASAGFMTHIEYMKHTYDPLKIRMLNDQMLLLDRIFIIPEGLPQRPASRHAIFNPGRFNHYGSSTFSGISDLVHEIDRLSCKKQLKRWELIKKHVSDLMIIVRSATSFLQPVAQI